MTQRGDQGWRFLKDWLPAHGAGSLCGKAISKETVSTIGEQRRSNYALQPMTREAFLELVTADQPDAPPYFTHDAVLNSRERPTLDQALARELRPLTIDELLAEARSGLDRLAPAEALAEQRDGALLIDTRSREERGRAGVIPGSLHIPLSVLEWRVDPDYDPAHHNRHVTGLEQRLVLVCAHGYSSSLAAARLRQLGFERATDVDGGFTAWAAEGLPVQPAPELDVAVPGMGDPDG